jgi:hypothetical protein
MDASDGRRGAAPANRRRSEGFRKVRYVFLNKYLQTLHIFINNIKVKK